MARAGRVDSLANALVAVGCPDKPCDACGTNAYSLATLTLEVLDELEDGESAGGRFTHYPGACVDDEDDGVTLAGAHLTAVRGERYGVPQENFARIAHLWHPIFGVTVTPQQVGLAMIAVKLARLIQTPDDEDSLVDLAGYAATLQLLAGRDPTV